MQKQYINKKNKSQFLLIKMNTPSTPTSCWYFLVFLHSEWASARGIDENIGGKNKEELNKNLRLFYGAAATKTVEITARVWYLVSEMA